MLGSRGAHGNALRLRAQISVVLNWCTPDPAASDIKHNVQRIERGKLARHAYERNPPGQHQTGHPRQSKQAK